MIPIPMVTDDNDRSTACRYGFHKHSSDILKDSKLTTIITNTQVAHSGVSVSLVLGHGVVQTKCAH